MTTNELLQECANLIEEMRVENRLHGHITDASARWLTRLKPQVEAHLSGVALSQEPHCTCNYPDDQTMSGHAAFCELAAMKEPAEMPEEPDKSLPFAEYMLCFSEYTMKLRTALAKALAENERLISANEHWHLRVTQERGMREQAEQRAAEREKDVARYRWLNAQDNFLSYIEHPNGSKTYRLKCGEALDKWIDAAIDAEREDKHD